MIIIPARLQSSRLPNKLLLPLGKLPIIIHVANIAKKVDSCIVACDSEEILEVCKKHKIEAILTDKNHQSGTDRCAEVAQKMGLSDDEVIINLQGDEPFIESGVIKALQNAMRAALDSKSVDSKNVDSKNLDSKNMDSKRTDFLNKSCDIFMASCYKKITNDDANDPNLVKVVLDSHFCALYFSRAKIPYNRDENSNIAQYFGHIGIYAFSAKSLREFCGMKKSKLEEIEKLEQLRALEAGKKILMVEVESRSIGIDTIDDYNRALERIKKDEK